MRYPHKLIFRKEKMEKWCNENTENYSKFKEDAEMLDGKEATKSDFKALVYGEIEYRIETEKGSFLILPEWCDRID